MLAARNFSEWYAFFGGEEMCVSRDDAARIWEAATKAAEARFTTTNMPTTPCYTEHRAIKEHHPGYDFCPGCGAKL